MKKQTLTVMALMTLMFASATFIGCKNYDSDIDQLKTDVAQNKAAIKVLQDAMSNGVMVSKIEAVSGGYKLTMTDGSTISLNHGKDGKQGLQGIQGPKGEKGDAAIAPQMRVNAAKNWEISIDGGTTWSEVKDVDGNPIADSKTFVKDNITVNQEGNVVIGGKITGYAFDVTIPAIILVPDDCIMTVSATDANGMIKTAVVPTLGYFDKWSVNSIKPMEQNPVFMINKTTLQNGATISGVAYEASALLYSSEGVEVILNPSKIDAEGIEFKFVAALEEGELYDMPVELKATPSKKGISTITKSAKTAVWTINLNGDNAVGELLLGDASELALSAQNSYGKGVRTMSEYVFAIAIQEGSASADPSGIVVQDAYIDGSVVVKAPKNVIASALRIAEQDLESIAVYKEDGTKVSTADGEYEAYTGNYMVRQVVVPETKTDESLDREYTLTYDCIGTDGNAASNASVNVKFINSSEIKTDLVIEKPLIPKNSDIATTTEITKDELLTAMFGENAIAKAEFVAKGINLAVVENKEVAEAGVKLAFSLNGTLNESIANVAAFDKLTISAAQKAFFADVETKEYSLSFEYQLQKSTPSADKVTFSVKFSLDGTSPVVSSKYEGSELTIPNTEDGVILNIEDIKIYSNEEATEEITTAGAVVGITSIVSSDDKVKLEITDNQGTPVYTLYRTGDAPADSDGSATIKFNGVDAWDNEFTTENITVTITKTGN